MMSKVKTNIQMKIAIIYLNFYFYLNSVKLIFKSILVLFLIIPVFSQLYNKKKNTFCALILFLLSDIEEM